MKAKIVQAYSEYSEQVRTLLTSLEGVDDVILNKKPAPGSWSALQTMHHLRMSETGALAYCQKKMSFETAFEKPDMGSHFRIIALRLLLHSPIKFKAPKVIAIENLPEQSSLEEIRTLWEQTMANWNAFLSQLPEDVIDKAVFKHPRAGRISWLQTIGFFKWHTARHTKQIRRAIQSAQ